VDAASNLPTKRTPLDALHRELGARMVEFAGYDMPLQYRAGILAEHTHCRAKAGLFDVSHMGQLTLSGADAAGALERLVPGDIAGLAPLRMRYTVFTNPAGGILDDLMVTRRERDLFVVVNAACKDADTRHLKAGLPDCTLTRLEDAALLALQGPAAAAVMTRLAPGAEKLAFLSAASLKVAGVACFVTRSGYTGEDGFEISCPGEHAMALARRLLGEPEVAPVGLGARDSLRLEAGLCLYGHDIDTTTTPIEAGLAWIISQRRRRDGGFPGAAIIQAQLANGPARRRVGMIPEGRLPAREGAPVLDAAGAAIGKVTSGGFGPTFNGPVAMGYVAAASAKPGTPIQLAVRDKRLPAKVAALPFVPHRYVRATSPA
jgi:aminomethyltransferase